MAELQPIQIQIDPEALRKQIREVVEAEFDEFSNRLRWAANALDAGKSDGRAFEDGIKYGRDNPDE